MSHVRILCLSETDRALHPLELQEDFVEVCRSEEFVEIRDKSEVEVRFSGNLVCLKSEDEFDYSLISNDYSNEDTFVSSGVGTVESNKKLTFKPFDDNRMGFAVKRKNQKNPFAKGSITFLTSTSTSDKVIYETKLDLSRFM